MTREKFREKHLALSLALDSAMNFEDPIAIYEGIGPSSTAVKKAAVELFNFQWPEKAIESHELTFGQLMDLVLWAEASIVRGGLLPI